MTIPATRRHHARANTVAALFLGTLVGSFSAAAQDKVPAEFQGDWVAATSDCQAPARFRVTETGMTLVNGKDSASYGDIGITHSFFGPDYQGISFVAIPEFNGSQPFTVYFNADEKKGVTKLDIYSEIKGTTNPQVLALQAASKKLAARFPLNQIPLERCPAK
jgi:hypothetical protein